SRSVGSGALGERVGGAGNVVPGLGAFLGILVADVVDRTVKSDSGADLVGSAQRPQIAAIAQIATPGADQAGVVLAVQVDQADLEGVELDVAVDGPAAVFFV